MVENSSTSGDYEAFREKLVSAKSTDKNGKEGIGPRYAVFDVAYDAPGGDGKRSKITFIAWSPDNASLKVRAVPIAVWVPSIAALIRCSSQK